MTWDEIVIRMGQLLGRVSIQPTGRSGGLVEWRRLDNSRIWFRVEVLPDGRFSLRVPYEDSEPLELDRAVLVVERALELYCAGAPCSLENIGLSSLIVSATREVAASR